MPVNKAGEKRQTGGKTRISDLRPFIWRQFYAAGKIGELLIGIGQFSAAIASGANTTTLKSGAGRLCRVSITTAGTASFTVFDNTSASGSTLFVSPATTSVGTVFDIQMPAQIGLTVQNQASGPAFTVSFD